MTPYYEDEKRGIVIYCGDAREVLPVLERVDYVLTDPPWITSAGNIEIRGKGVAPRRQASTSLKYGTLGFFDQALLRDAMALASSDRFVICGFRELGDVIAASGAIRGVFVWHKPNGTPTRFFPAKMDAAFIVWSGAASDIYGHQHYPSMVFSHCFPQAGCMASERFVDITGKSLHPAQGPLSLYVELMRPLAKGKVVFDPYMGTGTTLVAARTLGIRAIGSDIERKYCDMAIERLHSEQEVFDFAPEPEPVAEQMELLRCEAEIAAAEQQLREEHADMEPEAARKRLEGLGLYASDWAAEKRIIEGWK